MHTHFDQGPGRAARGSALALALKHILQDGQKQGQVGRGRAVSGRPRHPGDVADAGDQDNTDSSEFVGVFALTSFIDLEILHYL